MSGSTLILNADAQPMGYVPLSTLCWQEAVKLMYQERVDVIAEYEDWFVSSPSVTLKVPSIMLMHDYKNVTRKLKFSSKNIKLRDNYTCQYCGMESYSNPTELTMDHVIPRVDGGKTTWDNIVCACKACNMKKAHHYTMKPNTKPKRPSYYEIVDKARRYPVIIPHESWIDYIGWDTNLVKIKKPSKY
jgi:5-methylcytosine-specific restriction endonuclease McrA